MEFIADFHIHSRYSRATSRDLTLEALYGAALEKGVTVVGTGDFTHPAWMEEIREKLVPAEEGLFRLRPDLAREVEERVPRSCRGEVRFLLTTEISNIYKRGGRVRKVHNLVFCSTLETALWITGRLERIGNIASDGRPILGLDSRDLLEIVLESGPDSFLVPAHIWTPWFSVLGSKSGFDSLEECYGDLTTEIFSVETGLSSDPAMNWRLSALDRFNLMSNSDAHSAGKIGREANRFDCELSYPAIREALKRGREGGLRGTIEFFPEQGKYHLDGHRKCGCRMVPTETFARGGLCPVCGKKVTVGVMYRVEALADRPPGARPETALPYERLISLAEVVAEAKGVGPQSKAVRKTCGGLLQRLGPELLILTRLPLEEIAREGGELVAEGIGRMRRAEVILEEGYDGQFGLVRLFRPGERSILEGQMSLAGMAEPLREAEEGRPRGGPVGEPGPRREEGPGMGEPGVRAGELFPAASASRKDARWSPDLLERLNPEQREAVRLSGAPLLIVAGPGTGKTLTLTYRIASLVRERGVAPGEILAVTFTQRAAREMAARLEGLLGGPREGGGVRIRTFHALGAEILREVGSAHGVPRDFFILDGDESAGILARALPEASRRQVEELLEGISRAKRNLLYPDDGRDRFEGDELYEAFGRYEQLLGQYRALDYDDLVARAARLLEREPAVLREVTGRISAVCVDEYQDVNHAQYRLMRLVSSGTREICAIGDPHQAIYGFRGASPEYFLRFERDYPEGRILRLVRNYRCTPTILSASVEMLSAGLAPEEAPRLEAVGRQDAAIRVADLPTEKAEAVFIAQTIERLLGGTDSLSLYADKVSGEEGQACEGFGDIAVLARLKALLPGLEEALQYQGIPCRGPGGADLLGGREGRTLVALLRWGRNPEDRMAWERILAEAPGDGRELRERLIRFREERLRGEETVLAWIRALPEWADWLPIGEEPSWKAPWEALLRAAASFGRDWDGFLQGLLFSRETDLLERRTERVTLSTLHAAKGLEFPVVFIAGCEEGILPCRIGREACEPDEERRLFYVGMTRASRLLFLTRARSRFLYGERRQSGPSPFLAAISAERISRSSPSRKGGKKKARGGDQPMLFDLPGE